MHIQYIYIHTQKSYNTDRVRYPFDIVSLSMSRSCRFCLSVVPPFDFKSIGHTECVKFSVLLTFYTFTFLGLRLVEEVTWTHPGAVGKS